MKHRRTQARAAERAAREREAAAFEHCLRQQAELARMFNMEPTRIPELENFR